VDGYSPFRSLNIAVIGAGISGLSASWLLSTLHNVTLYEQENAPGGHSHTVQVPERDRLVEVDTGFIVYNEQNYPQFNALLQHLEVGTQPAPMSFSYSLSDGELEYCGSGLNGLFGQRKNLLNHRVWRLLRDLIRFYNESENKSALAPPNLTVGQFLEEHQYSKSFIDLHLIPLISAIWSTSGQTALQVPISSVVKFFSNHGLLKLHNRPSWRTISHGSHTYVWRLLNGTGTKIQLGRAIGSVSRSDSGVIVRDIHGSTLKHDVVVLATHADQALRLLSHPTKQERTLLGNFLYEKNKVVLHSDEKLMPSLKKLWSSWNVRSTNKTSDPLTVTYWMNKLQNLNCQRNYFVSLNPSSIDRSTQIYSEFSYSHPTQFREKTIPGSAEATLVMASMKMLWYPACK
jgi:predicted NAD/FAD-binding protein